MDSVAPDWLVELVGRQMRLMSANPRSVADAVWWEFVKRAEHDNIRQALIEQ